MALDTDSIHILVEPIGADTSLELGIEDCRDGAEPAPVSSLDNEVLALEGANTIFTLIASSAHAGSIFSDLHDWALIAMPQLVDQLILLADGLTFPF